MGTRSSIAIRRDSGLVESIYCHWDGYVDGVGKTLHLYYSADSLANQLISLGDISSLGAAISPGEGVSHSFNSPVVGVTVAYGRDRGETGIEAACWDSVEKWLSGDDSWFDFNYLWDCGSWWLVKRDGSRELVSDVLKSMVDH
jgi:hypothetical protein